MRVMISGSSSKATLSEKYAVSFCDECMFNSLFLKHKLKRKLEP